MNIRETLRYGLTALPTTIRSLVRHDGRRVPGLVPAGLAFVVAVFMVFLAWSGYLYPLRPDTIGAVGHMFTPDPRLEGSWGGTRLIGAWFIHASIALGWHTASVGVLRLLAAWQLRIDRRDPAATLAR